METGSISKWNVKEGDRFEVGTSLCEVETDKATVSFDATDDGFIAKILISTGDIKVGQPILVTVEESESVAAFANYTHTAEVSAEPVKPAAPQAAAAPATPAPTAAPTTTAATVSAKASGDRVFASPLAKKMARESGTSIAEVAAQLGNTGSGPNGRIIAADIMRASTMPRASATTATTSAATSTTSAAPATSTN